MIISYARQIFAFDLLSFLDYASFSRNLLLVSLMLEPFLIPNTKYGLTTKGTKGIPKLLKVRKTIFKN